jgi:hypothetical protein
MVGNGGVSLAGRYRREIADYLIDRHETLLAVWTMRRKGKMKSVNPTGQ